MPANLDILMCFGTCIQNFYVRDVCGSIWPAYFFKDKGADIFFLILYF